MSEERANIRLESVRALVQEMAMSLDSDVRRHESYVIMYGIRDFPGLNSAEAVRPLLRDMNLFAKEEQAAILKAILHLEDRSGIQGPYEEIVKDAYLLQLYIQQTERRFSQLDAKRLRHVLGEWAIPCDVAEETTLDSNEAIPHHADRRAKIADIAESLASQTIIGVPEDERYREICNYWPEVNIYKELQNSWCAAFVYHCCCRLAGLVLPIRYPNGICRFAGVAAWLEWAQLPETDFLNRDGVSGFTPQRGDIVIYEKLLSDNPHDHIGIVLACEEQDIRVAEGNRDNRNYSSVFKRERGRFIRGYVRIRDDYRFDESHTTH